MITIQALSDAFKTFYKPTVVDQMNTKINPFYAAIEKNSDEVVGSKIVMAMRYGVNGGVGNRPEDGDMPNPNSRKYKQAEYDTKNLFGTIRITEKSIRASASSAGAFVKLLEAELEGLVTDAKLNFGRQLFGDGAGKLATCAAATSVNTFGVSSVQFLAEGQMIDILSDAGVVKVAAREITSVDRTAKTITIDGTAVTTLATDIISISGSYGLELTGLGQIFKSTGKIYNLDRANYKWLIPQIISSVGAISDVKIKKGLHQSEIVADGKPDFLICSYGVERAYYDYLETTKRNVNTMEIGGGYTGINFDNKPLVSDRYCPDGALYMLIKDDFVLHQMGEGFDWLDRDGSIFKQTANKAAWDACMVNYCDLGNRRPIAQVQLTGITEA